MSPLFKPASYPLFAQIVSVQAEARMRASARRNFSGTSVLFIVGVSICRRRVGRGEREYGHGFSPLPGLAHALLTTSKRDEGTDLLLIPPPPHPATRSNAGKTGSLFLTHLSVVDVPVSYLNPSLVFILLHWIGDCLWLCSAGRTISVLPMRNPRC